MRFRYLQQLRAEHPNHKVIVRQGDANDFVCRICAKVPWHVARPGMHPAGQDRTPCHRFQVESVHSIEVTAIRISCHLVIVL